MLHRFITFLFLLMICSLGHAATYYFSSSTGDDSRNLQHAQYSETPWKSIQKLNSVFPILRPGDNILFKNGDTFHGVISIVKSGSLKAPISFGTYGSGKNPVITGFREIKDWVSKGNNLFEAEIPEINSSLSTLTIDGNMQAMGRFPNENSTNSGYLTIISYKNGLIEGDKLPNFPSFAGGEIVIRKNNWVIDRHLIISNTNTEINYETYISDHNPLLGFGFFIQNHPLTLDQHGEWYFDVSSKKLLLFYLGDPSRGNIRVATLPEIIKTKNRVSNISFENITFEGSNENLILLNGSSNFIFENCHLEYIGQNAISTVSSRNLTISNTTIKNSLNGGVFLGWDDYGFLVKNSTFDRIYNFAGMGKNGEMQGQSIYMSETTSDALIEFSNFSHSGYNAINFNGNNITIRNNLIDTFCFVKDDGAAIYTFTGESNIPFSNRKITKNIIINGIGAVDGTKPYNSSDFPYVEGIYLDRNSTGVEIHGNTITDVKSKGIYINNARNISITNNKIRNTGYAIYLVNDNLVKPITDLKVRNNEFSTVNDTQLHLYIKTELDDLSSLGNFDHNIYSGLENNSTTIFVHTPSKKGQIDLKTWKNWYGLDKNSTRIP